MEHLQHDIGCIARSTGNSDDEAIQIMHLVLVGIINDPGLQQGKLIVCLLLLHLILQVVST